ncbi:hypothetical protein A4X06_0g9101 [Tilletia controversa]|uniref:FHA domain-containing protein n=1 Tax=Tilletia controversa TaxID=13291 RepID=A0A8X7MJ74_9BASI|nr:hypothetical protein A4X06_0g9101 [Tilletia controversa]
MLTFIKFSPLEPAHHDFVFILHPHLRRRNIINDALLQLLFVVDDEARVQLQGQNPTICSSRVKFGIYLNHQLLGSTPSPFRDGDIVAFPQRRHNLKTAARFRVVMESLELSCGVDQDLPALRGFAQELEAEEIRGKLPGPSPNSTAALIGTNRTPTSAPSPSPLPAPTGTNWTGVRGLVEGIRVSTATIAGPRPGRDQGHERHAALTSVAPQHSSNIPHAISRPYAQLIGHSSPEASRSTADPSVPFPLPASASPIGPPAPSTAHGSPEALCVSALSSSGNSSTSVLTSGLSPVPAPLGPGSTATSGTTISPALCVAQDTPAQASTPSGSMSVAGPVTPPPSVSSSSITPLPSAQRSDGSARILPAADTALQRVGQALLQARLATSGMSTAVLAVERMRAAWREARGAIDSVAASLVLPADGPSVLTCPPHSVLNNRTHCADRGVPPGPHVVDRTLVSSSSPHSSVPALVDSRSLPLGCPVVSSFAPLPFAPTSPPQPQPLRAFQSVPDHHHSAAYTFMPCASWPWTWLPYLPHLPLYSHITQHPPMLFRSLHPYSPALVPIPFH